MMDGHGLHNGFAIIERAIEENIILLSLPPQFLQPLVRTFLEC